MEDHRGRIHRWPSSALVRCGLLLEGVLYLLARVFQARLRLVDLAFVLGAAVSGGLAYGLFGLAADVVNLVAHFVVGAHALLLPLDDLWSRWFASGGIYPACYRLKHMWDIGTMRVAILDDYQNVALSMADWSEVAARADITVFTDHLADQDAVVNRLAPFDVVCVMRERTSLPRTVIERLPRLKMIASTGTFNASIDVAAAEEHGIYVSTTG